MTFISLPSPIQTFTVGTGTSPVQPFRARGLYRRSGISPCPEGIYLNLFYQKRLKMLSFALVHIIVDTCELILSYFFKDSNCLR